MGAYTEISAAIKDASKAIQKSKDSDLRQKAIDLQGIAMNLNMENSDLKHQIEILKGQLAEKNQMALDKESLCRFQSFWVSDEATRDQIEAHGTPIDRDFLAHIYCPKCLVERNQLVPVNGYGSKENRLYQLMCPVCQYNEYIEFNI